MNNNLKKTGWALLVALTFFACKKEQKHENLQDEAKNWYLKNTQKASFSFKSSINSVEQVIQNPDWNNAQTFQLADGNEVVSVPLNIKRINGNETRGSYMLMIEKNGDSFKKLTVYNEAKDFFKNVSKDKVQSAYSQGEKLMDLQKRANTNPGRGKVMSEDNGGGMSDEPVCVNWYLVETYRDETGEVTAVVETFLYQTCYSSGPGNGGQGNGGNESGDVYLNFGTPVSYDNGGTVVFENDTLRTKKVIWTFSDGGTFKLKSREVLTQIRFASTGSWVFAPLTHDSEYPEGYSASGEISISDFRWQQVNYLNQVNAYVEWRTKISVTVPQAGGNGVKYGGWDESTHQWKSW